MPAERDATVEGSRPGLAVRLRGLLGAVGLSVVVGLALAAAVGVLLVVLLLLALTVLG